MVGSARGQPLAVHISAAEGAWPLSLLVEAVEIATAPTPAASLPACGQDQRLSVGAERQLRQSPVKRHTRCHGCARRKARCSSQLPCERCFNLCVRCESPNLAKGQPFVEVAIAMLDCQRINKQYMQAMHQLRSSDHLDRRFLLHHLHAWRTMSAQANADVTHGLFDEVCRRLAVTMAELSGVEQDMRKKEMGAMGGGSDVEALQAAIAGRIEQSETFKRLDDGSTLLIMAVSCAAGWAIGMNSVASRMFCTAEQGHHYVKSHGILPIHAFASMIAPNDRLAFFQLMIAMWSTALQPRTTFVKFCTSSGDIAVCILRVSSVKLPEFPDAHISMVVQVEPAPTSRHLMPRPGHRYHVMQAFRQRASPSAVDGAGADRAGAIGAPFAVPGMACFPLPPLYDGVPCRLRDTATASHQRHMMEPHGGNIVTPESSPRWH